MNEWTKKNINDSRVIDLLSLARKEAGVSTRYIGSITNVSHMTVVNIEGKVPGKVSPKKIATCIEKAIPIYQESIVVRMNGLMSEAARLQQIHANLEAVQDNMSAVDEGED
jgi:DNA-binding XRE family transcriptional regulator